jgi:DNA-binding response OmpR family regulator
MDRPVRVLVVEDQPDTAQVVTILLGLLGHAAEYVLRGREAIARTREFEPDVVVVDIGLPDISGFEVVQALRNSASGANRYIAAISGWDRRIDRTRARRAGFDDFLVKPLDLAKLRRLVAHRAAREHLGE